MIGQRHGGLVRTRRGASTVEFALLLPFLLLILFAILEYAWVGLSQTTLQHAVSQGAFAASRAREAAGEVPENFARTFVKEAYWLGAVDDGDVEVTRLGATDTLPERIEVTVQSLPYRPLTAMLPKACLPEKLGARAVVPMQ